MIFITLGSQKFQFDRLLEEVDRLIETSKIVDEVFAQIGNSDYRPIHYNFKGFLSRDEFTSVSSKANIIITHGGTGAIIGAVKQGKKVIAVPRLKKFGEHIDDHQVEIIKEFGNSDLIIACEDVSDLELALKNAKTKKFKKYISNTNNIINDIRLYLNEGD
ncbi:TPA: beta(1,3)galactosyltransferase EpsH [Streptococcus suis]|uniref:Glycosyltransferase n=1 Tax=Streptococcus suis TaxID=1307 RepID=M1VP36_STRSU|nr:glycosyltransferase [Streptococcus suis]HEM3177745.1 beta(1,3)galactosyltransferase EpsH [Streptococcus suis]